MYLVDEVSDLQALPERFDAPRPDFNPDDPHFVETYCRVDAPPQRGAEEDEGWTQR